MVGRVVRSGTKLIQNCPVRFLDSWSPCIHYFASNHMNKCNISVMRLALMYCQSITVAVLWV